MLGNHTPATGQCGLGVVCDDLNTLKSDVDKFMEQASTDFALVTGRHLAVQSRLDNLKTQMAAFILQLNRVERYINQSQAAAAEAE